MSEWLDLLYRLNPLIRREMDRSMRSMRIHFLLFAMPVFLVLAMARSPIVLLVGQKLTPGEAALNGFIFCSYYLGYLVMPALAVGTVLFEKDSGSFEMLQTAGLNGWRILLGKANGLFPVFGLILLTGLPILSAASAFFGGVTGTDMVALYAVSLMAAFRAAAIGFLAVSLTWNLVSSLLLSYTILFGWPWLVRALSLAIPPLGDIESVLIPVDTLHSLIQAGEVAPVDVLGITMPFWMGSILFSLAFSVGCLIVASPLTVLPPSTRIAAFRPWLARLKGRRFRLRNLLPNRCNIIFERDFRMGIFSGSWMLYGLYALAVVVTFIAVGFYKPWMVAAIRLLVGLPLFVVLAIRSALTINRMRRTRIIETIFLTHITPKGVVQAKFFFPFVIVAPLVLGAFVADTLHGYPDPGPMKPYSLSSVYLRAADEADDFWGGHSIPGQQATTLLRPLGVLIQQVIFGLLYYLQILIDIAAILAIGIFCSTQYNNANSSMLHSLSWSAMVIFLSNLLLLIVGFVVFYVILFYFGVIGALSEARTGLATTVTLVLMLTLIFIFWTTYMLRYVLSQYQDAVRTLERSQKMDEFAAPPTLYAATSKRDLPMETESWWGRGDF